MTSKKAKQNLDRNFRTSGTNHDFWQNKNSEKWNKNLNAHGTNHKLCMQKKILYVEHISDYSGITFSNKRNIIIKILIQKDRTIINQRKKWMKRRKMGKENKCNKKERKNST